MQSNTRKGFRKLVIWHKGKEFLKDIYITSESFPRSETFGLQSQLRRSTLSFLLNIVEGQRRNSAKDFLKFLNIAESSLVETEACLEIASELNYLNQKTYDKLDSKRVELALMTQALIKSIRKKI